MKKNSANSPPCSPSFTLSKKLMTVVFDRNVNSKSRFFCRCFFIFSAPLDFKSEMQKRLSKISCFSFLHFNVFSISLSAKNLSVFCCYFFLSQLLFGSFEIECNLNFVGVRFVSVFSLFEIITAFFYVNFFTSHYLLTRWREKKRSFFPGT